MLADEPKCTCRCSAYGGWNFNGPGFEPTGEPLFATGAGSNSGSYSDPKMDKLITETHTSSSLDVRSTSTPPTPRSSCRSSGCRPNPYGIQAVTSKLTTWPSTRCSAWLPEYWYFTK